LRWWQPFAGTVVLAVMVLFGAAEPALLVRKATGYTGNLALLGGNTELVLDLIGLSLILPAVLAVTRWIGGRPASTVASITGHIRWRWLGRCALAAFLSILAGFAVAAVLFIIRAIANVRTQQAGAATEPLPEHLHAPIGFLITAVLISVGCVCLLTVFQASAEEFLFRGWLLQAVGAFTRSRWPAILVQAAAFAILHGLHGTVWGYLDLVGSAILLGWLVTETGGLEVSIAMHVLWDVLLSAPAAALVTLFPSVTDPATVNASDGGWQLPVIDLIVLACYTLIIRRAHRRRSIKEHPAADPQLSPTVQGVR
jgi:membrane protease YdiL (CAAX protease family)